MAKKVSKIFLYSLVSIILLIGGIGVYTQTGAFRSNLRSLLYNLVQSNLHATVYFGEIRGNFVTGFSIDSLLVYVDNAPFVETGKISVRYDILKLIGNDKSIDSVRIENPVVHLFRRTDSVWNVDRLALSPSVPDSTESPLHIGIRSLQVANGAFSLLDSTGDIHSLVRIDGKKAINYSNINAQKIHLDVEASYSAQQLTANVKNLSFDAPRENFHLTKFSADVRYTRDTAVVKHLTIVTPNTKLLVDASVAGTDVFRIKDLKQFQNLPTSVAISQSTIGMTDLQTFLPVLYFLKGNVYLDGLFQGTFEQLNVKKLDVSFAHTGLHLSGAVSNLYVPEDLRLNIVSKQSTINAPDVSILLPYFNIPEFKDLGMMTVDFQYVGKPLDFMAVTTVKSTAGLISVDGEMLITEENIHYKGLIAGKNVNLEKVFSSSDLASRINTKTYVEGKGTSIDNLNAEATVEIDSSSFHGIPITSASVSVKAAEKKIHSTIAVTSQEGDLRTNGTINFNPQKPQYSFNTQARHVNLASVFNDNYYASDVSFDLERSADNFGLFQGESKTHVTVLPSIFQGNPIDTSEIDVAVSTDSSRQRTVVIQSPVVDGTISGFFTFSGLLHTLQTSARQFQNVYAYQRHVVDSSFYVGPDTTHHEFSDTTRNTIDYTLTVKNLTPVTKLFKLPSVKVSGNLEGRLEGNEQTASLNGKIDVQRFSYFHDSTNIEGRQIAVAYSVQDIPENERRGILPLNFNISTGASELLLNTTILRNISMGLNVRDTAGRFSFMSDIDTTKSIGMEGELTVLNNAEKLKLSRFYGKYQGFEFENGDTLSMEVNDSGARIDSALLLHRGSPIIVSGSYTYNGNIEATGTLKNFDISDIHYFNLDQDFREKTALFNGTIQAQANVSGTIDDPRFSLSLRGDTLSYQKTALGNLTAVLKYAKKYAAVNIEISNKGDSSKAPALKIEGRIPVDLRLSDIANRTDYNGLELTLKSTHLLFSALDPFIPELITQGGFIQSDIQLTGSLKNPVLNGSAKLFDGRFIMEMNGITYSANGSILFNNNIASFSSFTINNRPSDYPAGAMGVGGHIVLSGFVPEEYHLRTRGDLMVLTEQSRTVGSKMYGSLIASTGTDSLRFDGNFQKSRVTGIVYIDQSSLNFPPTQQALSYSSSVYSKVEFVDDTSKPVIDTLLIDRLAQSLQQAKLLPTMNGKTFLDGFGYELTIQTRGRVLVNMIFNASAGAREELQAELNGKLILSKDDNGLQLNGTINVGSGTYTFYKQFNASGTLTFLGNPQNPQLDIVATYEGTHIPDPKNAPNVEERAVVTLNISGSRIQPKIQLGLKTIDQNGKEIVRTGDVENDAISFLLTSSPGVPGKFRDELSADDKNRISDQLTSTIGGTFVNSLLSGYVNGFIQKNNIPFVKTVEFHKVVEADPEIKIGAEVLNAYVNVGGRVFSNPNNANISVQIPLGNKQKRNFMLEVEKKTENFDYSNQARTILDARIFYRFTF